MNINFSKYQDGLVPAIVQDNTTKNVLMLGYMNKEAYAKTLERKKVTFFSRSKNRLWTKGETSGNYLNLVAIKIDCDQDALLVFVNPVGPTCHTGSDTCWDAKNENSYGFISELEAIINDRKNTIDSKQSYVASLFKEGMNKIAQKVGEEAVEVIIEAKDNNADLFINEAADLLFHYLILLQAKDFTFDTVVKVLKERSR